MSLFNLSLLCHFRCDIDKEGSVWLQFGCGKPIQLQNEFSGKLSPGSLVGGGGIVKPVGDYKPTPLQLR